MRAISVKQMTHGVKSPCIEICIVNDEKICLGCFRSLGEIAQWQAMDDTTRREVLLKAESRRKAYDVLRRS